MRRFGFNALGLIAGAPRGGAANYQFYLARALAAALRADGAMPSELHLYMRDDYHDLDECAGNGAIIHRQAIPSSPRGIQFVARVAFEQTCFARIAQRDRLDLLHFPDHVGAVLQPTSCPMTLTVLDLTVFSHPETHSARTRVYMQQLIPPSLHKARAILCISQSTERDVLARFPETAGRTHAIPLAADGRFRREAVESVRAQVESYGLEADSYLLYLGTVEPRKNVEGLIRAYARAAQLIAMPPLIIAGRIGRYSDHLPSLPHELGIGDKVRFLGFVPDAQAITLYNGALAVVYTSLYEGFGLPVLEAMACGAPIVTSNVSSLPEVAGDAAILVNPHDEEALANALIAIVNQPALRSAMRAKGLEQAARFSWERTAEATLAVWHNVVSTHGDA